MDESRDKRVMELVHSCAEMSGEARVSFLDAECNGDGDLRRAVEELIDESVNKTSSHVLTNHLDAHLPSHYRLVGLVGSGGMAEVFLAEDTRLDRRVAIKFLNDTFRRDPERMKRFNQEARAASALNHPNILTIHDIGDADGVQYIVSEFVDGETLGDRIRKGKLSPENAVELAIQIASALNAAHSAGIVHRDLKPDNIMLRSDGSVKVVDFGLAKGTGVVTHSAGLEAHTVEAVTTSPGIILGTPRYMSPEQTRGLPLDGRSDIFSLGIILFEMLTAKSPFGGSNVVDVIANIIGKEPRKIAKYAPDTPPDLIAIVERCLEKDREKRYATVGELLQELKDVRNELIGSSQSLRETRRARVAAPGAGYYKWALAGVLLAIILGGAWLWFGRGRSPIGSGVMRSVPVASWSTTSAEAVSAASFSPDAKMVAFASTKAGPSEIWVKQTSGGDPVQVTKNSFYNQYPVWSPDGQEIAYFSSRADNRGIWKVAFTGGQETQLASAATSNARPIRWTADKRLFFQDEGEVFVLAAGSADANKLTDLAETGLKPRTIAVSPDGASFAVSVKEDGVWKVKTRRFDGGQFVEVATSKDQVDNIAFHPNGRDLFYTGGVDGTYQIFAAGPGTTAVQISSGSSDLSLQDVSADGTKVLYNGVTETSDLWLVNIADVKESVVANDTSEEYWPDVSPDGKMVAYQAVAQPDKPYRGSVWVKPLAGGNPVQVAAEGFSPVWSPDGQWIAFFRRSGTGSIGLWKVRPTGADARAVVEGPINAPSYLSVPYAKSMIDQIAWKPDSSALAYSAGFDGVPNSAVIGMEGGATQKLTSNADKSESFNCPTWSDDGKNIAIFSQTSGGKGFRLWIASSEGGEAKRVFESSSEFRFLGWSRDELIIAMRSDPRSFDTISPSTNILAVSLAGATRSIATLANAYISNIHLSGDGQAIAYASRSNGLSEIWSVTIGGGPPRKVIAQNDPKILISSLRWTPDGKALVFGKQMRTNVLSMLTN